MARHSLPLYPHRFTVALLCLLALGAAAAPTHGQTDHDIQTAMKGLTAFLLQHQDQRTGRLGQGEYENSVHRGGDTALMLAALLAAGESYQQPRLRQAVTYLQRTRPQSVYAAGCRLLVWSQLPDNFLPFLEQDAQWLLSRQLDGQFGYTTGISPNNSTTHFGVLGLWEAAQRGFPVPPSFWRQVQNAFAGMQHASGGWGYTANDLPTASMTAAGLSLMFFVQQQTNRRLDTPAEPLQELITGGHGWLNIRFQGAGNVAGSADWDCYYLFALERAMLAAGYAQLNGQDWYRAGARDLLARLSAVPNSPVPALSLGGNEVQSALALLFLARGRAPLWITKLNSRDLPDLRPDDLYWLTRRLSDLSETSYQWQRADVDDALDAWRRTPVLYVSGDRPLVLTLDQEYRLRQYLELGGTLVAAPVRGSGRFRQSIETLAQRLFPQWPLQTLPREHELYTALHQLSVRSQEDVQAVSNGARELLLLAERDWSYQWQAQPLGDATAAQQLSVNLWALLTERGRLPPRLVEPPTTPAFADSQRSMVLARVRYGALPLIEPRAWQVLGSTWLARDGVRLLTPAIDLLDLTPDLPLAHLAGVQPYDFNDAELETLERYARAGGVLLVETVGGQAGFARQLMRQLEKRFGGAAVRIQGAHPLLSGAGLTGGHDCRTVQWRTYAQVRMTLGREPRLAALFLDERPAVIFSDEDLSLGLLGVSRWGVLGYAPAAARALGDNLLRWVDQGAPAGAGAGD